MPNNHEKYKTAKKQCQFCGPISTLNVRKKKERRKKKPFLQLPLNAVSFEVLSYSRWSFEMGVCLSKFEKFWHTMGAIRTFCILSVQPLSFYTPSLSNKQMQTKTCFILFLCPNFLWRRHDTGKKALVQILKIII